MPSKTDPNLATKLFTLGIDDDDDDDDDDDFCLSSPKAILPEPSERFSICCVVTSLATCTTQSTAVLP